VEITIAVVAAPHSARETSMGTKAFRIGGMLREEYGASLCPKHLNRI
jgi:hypothetical protein